MKILNRTIAPAALACLMAVGAHAQVEDAAMNASRFRRTISVVGTGKISAAPDVAEINVGVVTQATEASAALSANSEAMTAIVALLKERGVAEKDVQTVSINIHPQYTQPNRVPQQPATDFVPRIAGYNVTNAVQITARDLKKLGAILDAVVKSGANQINGISFRVAAPEKLLDQARKNAMNDARRKAEQLAGESGVVVGLPISIQEGGGYQPPMPQFAARMSMMADAAVPVSPGEQELSVSVSVTYELKEAK